VETYGRVDCAGLMGFPGRPAYSASKHGIIGLTKIAALEYAQKGIRVNAVCPGWISTPMTEPALDDPELKEQIIAREPVGRIGNPEEVAEAAVWLCSDASSFVTGHSLVVDDGLVAGWCGALVQYSFQLHLTFHK